MQTTIKSTVSFTGVGLHTGKPVRIDVQPASAEYGIWFRRVDVVDADPFIPARWDAVVSSTLCTKLENDAGVAVSTVEHLMAALAGCGIHNALIEIDGPEVPILDGSSARFVRAFVKKGVRQLDTAVRAIKILKVVEVRDGEAFARVEPADDFEIDFHIDFIDEAIGKQSKSLGMANGAFVHELCDSRTFCRQSDVDYMLNSGMALGGSLKNAVVVDGAEVLTPGGLRHRDEAVRHKMLDAVGDLALAAAPIIGRYTGHRAGHALTNALVRAIYNTPGAFRMVDCDAVASAKLPGTGVSIRDIAGLPRFA